MKRHRDAFLDGLTDEEYAIHQDQVQKGTMEKIMAVLRSKDPKKAAEDLERDGEIHDESDAADDH